MLNILTPPFDTNEILANKRALSRQLANREGLLEKKIALLGGSTIGEIRSMLELFLLDQGIRPLFYEGAHTSFYEELAFPNPDLEAFAPDVIYVHTTVRNLTQSPHPAMTAEGREELLNSTLEWWKGMWDEAAGRYGCVIIQNNFEMPPFRVMGNMEAVHPNGQIRFIGDLNQGLARYQEETARFYVQDINYLCALAGLDQWHNQQNWYLYHYALGLEAFPLLCHSLSSMIKAIYGFNKKALILDMDNTFWGGVIGDDGVAGIELGPETPQGRAFADFQSYAKTLSETGVLLGIASKNDEFNALQGLNHPSSRLKREDFISFRANWEPKPGNLEAISRELNIGIDSLVFADDYPAERQAVQGFLPQVATVPLTAGEPEVSIGLLDRQGYFELVSLSQDDMNRNAAYRDNIQREALRASFSAALCRVLDRYASSGDTASCFYQDFPSLKQACSRVSNVYLQVKEAKGQVSLTAISYQGDQVIPQYRFLIKKEGDPSFTPLSDYSREPGLILDSACTAGCQIRVEARAEGASDDVSYDVIRLP